MTTWPKDEIDDACRAKYKGSPYLGSMTNARARSATVRVTPQDEDSRRPI